MVNSEAELASVCDHPGFAIFISDTTGRFLYVNKAFENLTHYSSQELLMVHSEFSASAATLVLPCIKSLLKNPGQPVTIQGQIRRKSGEEITIRICLSMMTDTNGQAINVVGVAENITDPHLEKNFLQRRTAEGAEGQMDQVRLLSPKVKKTATDAVDKIKLQPQLSMAGSIDPPGLRETEKKLREEEERFKGTFENAAVGIAHVGPDGKWLLVNNRLCEIVGYTQEELLQRTFQDITFPDDLRADLHALGQLVEGKINTYSMEKRYIHKQGHLLWINLTVSLVRNRNGSPHYFISIIEDITDRKKAEEALRESNERYRLINMATQDCVWDWNLVTNELTWNEAVYTLFHYEPKAVEATIEWWYETIHPDERERVVQGIHKVIDNGATSWSDEYRYRCGNGLYKNVYDRGFVLHDEAGRPVRMVGSMQDITQRNQVLQALEEKEERFRRLANSISQLAWIANEEGWIYWYNDRWYEYTGTRLAEMEGWGWQKVHHPQHVNYVVSFVNEAWKKGEPYELTFPLRGKDGAFRWFLTRVYPVKNNEGKVLQWIGTNTDIHDQKTLAEKLETMVAERTRDLQRSNEDLQQFAHVASHDLKEPVRKVGTFSSMLERELAGSLTEKSKRYLDKIQLATVRIMQLIDGTLAYSSINAKEEKVELIDLNTVIRNITNDLEVLILEKQATVSANDLPVIEGANLLIHQLFYNLINNALKFSRPSVPPAISIASSSTTLNGQNCYKILVADNGIGFAQAYADKIFDAYTRLHSKDKFEGTGLGLAFCRKIVQRHRGTIEATGKVNEGAIFHITLPEKQPV
jgi:PAS domain S-box-containing protein